MKKLFIFVSFFLLLSTPAWSQGFLSQDEVPHTASFLPPPPDNTSLTFAHDQNIYWNTRSLKGTDRWEKAAFYADIDRNIGLFFSDITGLSITKDRSPQTYNLIIRVRQDISNAASSAKKHYMRVRPFVFFNQGNGSTCFPKDEKNLKTDGSYPSGHTSLGWGLAQVYAELFPEKQEAIQARGIEYGYARVICGVHWQSDVNAGYLVGASVMSSLHDNYEFLEAMERAKAELSQIHPR
jgi:acid phosphatase (class A)